MAFSHPTTERLAPVEPPPTIQPEGEWRPIPVFDTEDLPRPYFEEPS